VARNRDTWYRLDNVGKFYSAQAGAARQTVFRYSATLVDPVDPPSLQHALAQTVAAFPAFNVCLRDGLFWHYLQQLPHVPAVTPENLPVCYSLHAGPGSVLFRVTHHGPRVNFEVSHIVSDGRGSLGFFKELLRNYLVERYGIEGTHPEPAGTSAQKAEDSFDKYYERRKAASTHMPRPYRIVGWRDPADPTFMELHMPVAPVLDLARSWGVSLTSLVIAVLIDGIAADMPSRNRTRPICIDVPVDLRQFFDSATTRNFFGLAYVSHVPGEGAPVPIERLAANVQAQLKAATDPEHLKHRMNRMIALEKNPLLRFAPLVLKDLVLGIADRVTLGETTATVSNLGAIRLDARLAPYVRDVNIMTTASGLKVTLCSFGDDLSIGFATDYSNHSAVRALCRFFSKRGVPLRMNVSKTADEVAQDQLEVAFEEQVKQAAERVDRTARKRRAPAADTPGASHLASTPESPGAPDAPEPQLNNGGTNHLSPCLAADNPCIPQPTAAPASPDARGVSDTQVNGVGEESR